MLLKSFTAALAAVGLTLAASQAQAATFTGSWGLTYNSADPGLVIDIEAINPSFNFTLSDADQIRVIPLFKIYTTEASVNAGGRGGDDDIIPKPINLTFTFSAPTPNGGANVVGITGGVNLLVGQLGYLDWDTSSLLNTSGSTHLDFGVGQPQGLLTIGVNGGTFNSGLGRLSGGANKGLIVYGTFDWDRDALAVPEPGAWALMIVGFGLAGSTLRRRRAMAFRA